MIEIAALVVAVAGVVAIVVTGRQLTRTLQSLDETMQTLRVERQHHRREPPAQQQGSHPVIKVMAFKAGASRVARHLKER